MQAEEDFFLEFLERTRKRRKVGDIIAMKTPSGYLIGRVVDTAAQWSSDPRAKANLLYIYSPLFDAKPTVFDAEHLRLHDLLLPPVMTDNQGWLQGYFETVGNVNIERTETLTRHCFYNDLTDTFWDERGIQLRGKSKWAGRASIIGLGGVAYLVKRALSQQAPGERNVDRPDEGS